MTVATTFAGILKTAGGTSADCDVNCDAVDLKELNPLTGVCSEDEGGYNTNGGNINPSNGVATDCNTDMNTGVGATACSCTDGNAQYFAGINKCEVPVAS